jgi:hypothetical protein
MGHCNPRQIFPINTCDRHGTSNNEQPWVTNASSFFCLLCCCGVKATSSRSSTCICDRESRSLESLTSVILHWKRANKVFWEAIFATTCLLLQVLHHTSSTSMSDACRGSPPSTRTPSGKASSSPDRYHQGTAVSPLKSYLTYLICLSV